MDAIALVHGPGWPGAPPEAVARLIGALEADPTAAVAILLAPQTDTLKSLDRSGLVTGTLDRTAFHAVLTPIAVRPSGLPVEGRRPAAGKPLPTAAEILAACRAAGCAVLEVPAT